MSLIDFVCTEYDHYIFIDWTVIRAYATLPEPLVVGGRERRNFTGASNHTTGVVRRIREEEVIENVFSDHYLEYFAGLSAEELTAVRRILSGEKVQAILSAFGNGGLPCLQNGVVI